MIPKSAQSTIDSASLQEMLDATTSAAKTALVGMAQYETPAWFAEQMARLIPGHIVSAYDPQCASGVLLRAAGTSSAHRYGVEIDRRFRDADIASGTTGIMRITANCVDVHELMDELYPHLTFAVQVANPPFSLSLKTKSGPVDSTLWTWRELLKRCGNNGAGYLIANRKTIERLKLDTEPRAYLYQTFPTGIFDNANVEIGVLHFHGGHDSGPVRFNHTSSNPLDIRSAILNSSAIQDADHGLCGAYGWTPPSINQVFSAMAVIIAEEKRANVSPFNIWLDGRGMLRTYLSTREKIVRKLGPKEIARLASLNNAHPLALTPEKETRLLLQSVIDDGSYTLDPKAREAIVAALASVTELAIPLMPVTDFQRVAYCDEEETLCARVSTTGSQKIVLDPASGLSVPAPKLTRGKHYPLVTATYEFVNSYQRKKLHLGEGGTYAATHNLTLSGQDRYIQVRDDDGRIYRFMDRPSPVAKGHVELADDQLWQFFERPEVQTVAEKFPERIEQNRKLLDAIELIAGFEYFPGQKPYLCRVGCLDHGLIGAETGVGKSLMCISLIAMKAPKRALIIAPQGTTRAPKDDDEDQPDMTASQWISELHRFAPGLQIFELFSPDDYERITSLNGGQLPHGIYVTYYEAMFSNGAREWDSASLDDAKLFKESDLPWSADDRDKRDHCECIGTERNGIRCISRPCFATQIGHLFDFIGLDEAHKAAHLSANLTQMLIRLQPRYRFAFTATPIPNLVSDLFPLAGWLCVPDWYRGNRRNAAWPYARNEGGRFTKTFLSAERDLTQEAMNRELKEPKKGKVEKSSPVLSAPARLLKLITPWMAYISKKDCNPNLPPRIVRDLRVPMGYMQSKLYGHYMERANVPAKNALEAASKQITILRAITADPAGTDWNCVPSVACSSNFNPKATAILSEIAKCLARGEQVVVVNARVGQTSFLQRKLIEAGIKVSRIDGTLPAEQHTAQANLFKRKKADVMLMGIKCAQAHSFVQCWNLIIGSLEYSYGSVEQAVGRVYRVTTPHAVNVLCVLCQNSIEEIMFDTVATKGDAATICLQGKRVPRDYKPTDMSEVLAINFEQFKSGGSLGAITEESCEEQWPAIKKALRLAINKLAA